MYSTKKFLELQYARMSNDATRTQVIAQYKQYANEMDVLIEAYTEILLAENPTVYASSIWHQQPGKMYVTGLWRTREQAIADLEKNCSNTDYDAQRDYKATEKEQKLADIKDKTLVKKMVLRELANK